MSQGTRYTVDGYACIFSGCGTQVRRRCTSYNRPFSLLHQPFCHIKFWLFLGFPYTSLFGLPQLQIQLNVKSSSLIYLPLLLNLQDMEFSHWAWSIYTKTATRFVLLCVCVCVRACTNAWPRSRAHIDPALQIMM